MKMEKISSKQQKIIGIFLERGVISSSDAHGAILKMGEDLSLVTIKRTLSEMVSEKLLEIEGLGRATKYKISALGRIFAEVDAKKYSSVEPDRRYGLNSYNFDLLPSLPAEIFSDGELKVLNDATEEYERRTKDLPLAIQKKELERLIIELSWKSSKIEGNTYTLLDTEKLILENKEAPGHDKKEAQMILNHKDAFNFIHENKSRFKILTRKNLEELHALLVKDLSVGLGLRSKPVGVTGSIYKPLDNIHQISEAVSELSLSVDRMQTPYAKALIALLGISYIQPFADGNKRTARLMANALLLAHGSAPLSYRSVDENDYREAVFVFYELNSITPFKKIFVDQYDFAAKNYAVK
jgi:fido (protein-threonine AMPylation protein)